MLKLENVVKDYNSGDNVVEALKGISVEFRESEFVAVLGPSGCGKTTLLNIIGGLDQYTTGDLIINGRSTKEYKDKDWDNYRNHSVGFVFQSYNLIPHQTIVENVEIALTLSGVSKKERRRKAVEVLEKVGLNDKLNVRPNQLSGGQMQRVAIARALVNNPDILLADEPTGALDTKTSIQIMELLKEIAKEKLVVMVTHNPEIANKYSTRTIKLLDGLMIDDSNPYAPTKEDLKREEEALKLEESKNKASMSFFTALSLSLKNLLTKKTRSLLVAFAGSIGIIGIALILSVSNGFQLYIDKVQEDTLSTYPVTIAEKTIDMTSVLQNIMGSAGEDVDHDLDKVYSSTVMIEMLKTMMAEQYDNNLKDFKKYLDDNQDTIGEYVSDIKYSYNIDLNIYSSDTTKDVVRVNPSSIMSDMFSSGGNGMQMAALSTQVETFSEMIDNKELLSSQYDIVQGKWPTNYDEVVLVVNENNEINDYSLYALGIKDQKELIDIMNKVMRGEEVEIPSSSYSYEEMLNLTFKLVLQPDYYVKNEMGGYDDKTEDEAHLKNLVDNALELKVVGIIKPSESGVAQSINGVIAYTSDLTKYAINQINSREIVKAQLESPEIDVITGKRFEKTEVTIEILEGYIATLDETSKAQYQQFKDYYTSIYGDEAEGKIIEYFNSYFNTENTYESNLTLLGINDLSSPSMISFYPKDFASKDKIISLIEEYNKNQNTLGNENNVIQYTDYIGILMSSISDVINAVTYVLIAFVAISLVVSSIMIGIITYISVLERNKEIGILRAVGASKHDISTVFNAETLIIGFTSGVIGILATIILDIPINIIIYHLAQISNVAKLPIYGGVSLVLISMILSLVAGLIPARIAAKKDPVVALRSE